jgi:hypothetical protein
MSNPEPEVILSHGLLDESSATDEITEPTDAEMLTLIRKEMKRRLTGGAVEEYTIGGRSAGTAIVSTPLNKLMEMEEYYDKRVSKAAAVSARRGTRTLGMIGRPR